MKKFLLIAAIAVVGANVNAQETRFGVKGGFAYSTLKSEFKDTDFKASSKGKPTFYVAGLVEHKFDDHFAVQAEVGYSPLGGKHTYDVDGESFSSKLELGTLNVPLMAKYYFTENMNVHIGANLGFILSAKQKVGDNFGDDVFGIGDALEDLVSEETDVKDYVKSFAVSPFVGVEYNLENGIFFDARYNLGVSNLAKEVNGQEYSSLKNSFFQIGMGFKFGGN